MNDPVEQAPDCTTKSNKDAGKPCSNLCDWKFALNDPSIVTYHMIVGNVKEEFKPNDMFSNIPWRLNSSDLSGMNVLAFKSDADVPGSGDVKPPAEESFPKVHYLDLRRQQNTQWADQRLREGIQIASEQPLTSSSYTKALTVYQQGLELVPNHVDLLVAMGALQASYGEYDSAISLFQRAQILEPNHANARTYMDQVLAALERQNIRAYSTSRETGAIVTKAERASMDASLERSLLANFETAVAAAGSYDRQYPLVENDLRPSGHRRESREKKGRSKRRKKKKRSKDRKRRKHKKTKHRDGRHADDESSSSLSSQDYLSSSVTSLTDSSNHYSLSHKRRKRKRDRKDEKKDTKLQHTCVIVKGLPLKGEDDGGDRHSDSEVSKHIRDRLSACKSSPGGSDGTRDSVALYRAQNLRRHMDLHDRSERTTSDSPPAARHRRKRPRLRSTCEDSHDGSGTVNSLNLISNRKRGRPSLDELNAE